MARSKSSGRWLKEHFRDEYVKIANSVGLRSRSAHKLIQMQDRDRFIKPGDTVVDLGAAPGGWSQVASKEVGDAGRVIALDILPMDALAGVEFIQGDFSEDNTLDRLIKTVNDQPVDLVICDIAPNMSGVKSVDQAKALYLAELAADFAQQVLRRGGHFLVKVFQGAGLDDLRDQLKQQYSDLKVRKPKASRNRSSEHYLLAVRFKDNK